MARLVVTVGANSPLKRLIKSMAAGMLGAIKDGHADAAAHFATLAADAAFAYNPALANHLRGDTP